MRALATAATGMQAQEMNVEVISHNLANMNTIGFKRQRAEFEDLIYQNHQSPGANSSDSGTIVPTGVQVGLGVQAGSIFRNYDQGSLEETGNDFDLGISGRGFFHIQLPNGESAYTRSGNFTVSPDGLLVTQDGYQVMPGITVNNEGREIIVNPEGQVQILIDGQAAPQVVGQIELVTFINEGGLQAIGDNLHKESAASGAPNAGVAGQIGFGQIRQGFIERSNVDAVTEVTSLIQAQRAYEMNARVISAADEMMAASSNLR